jgi:cyclopropane-fatty-acyl-phospholipid synthase
MLAQLQVAPGARVLEIGCGWGGFAETAARAGVHVTGLTLSHEQLSYAKVRLAVAGLSAKADLQLCDYRDAEGQYDAVASIEMFEAVGQQYWADYFACVARKLKPGGRACAAHPLLTLGVMARIHWQALRLWCKRAPFFSKPPAPTEELSK